MSDTADTPTGAAGDQHQSQPLRPPSTTASSRARSPRPAPLPMGRRRAQRRECEDEEADQGNALFPVQSLTESQIEGMTGGRIRELDVRKLIRCIQCPTCNKPMGTPIRLPCNNWVCEICLLGPDERLNDIPKEAGKKFSKENILVKCPFFDERCILNRKEMCGIVHSLDECTVDFTLKYVVENFKRTIERFFIPGNEVHTVSLYITSGDPGDNGGVRENERVLFEGRLIGTYRLAEQGDLPYNACVRYQAPNEERNSSSSLDNKVFSRFRKSVEGFFTCFMCIKVMLHPIITSCGHSHCAPCFERWRRKETGRTVCPTCRDFVLGKGNWSERHHSRLQGLIEELLPNKLAMLEEQHAAGVLAVRDRLPVIDGLFCPGKYQVVLDARNEGVIKYAIRYAGGYVGLFKSENDNGRPPYKRYGILFHIDNAELSGRYSVIRGSGTAVIKITDIDVALGVSIATVEEVLDLAPTTSIQDPGPLIDFTLPISHMFYGEILGIETFFLFDFVWNYFNPNFEFGFPWPRATLETFDIEPPKNSENLPYWITQRVMVPLHEQYRLLETNNVRHRMLIACSWMIKIVDREW
ncbi:hypothetical protein AJ79_08478 [Helicocarpus griseus UAMH5409]|uniref:RING-type domain-containing protein n=1 Tax=Helicocarpus griseus UAMH5409 TaxID=1447875 RepID=A0A2B7WSR3_9EURO|nr:hypothetical protein AJ79_08478 [Helicocarpus griseus UAMH5409]